MFRAVDAQVAVGEGLVEEVAVGRGAGAGRTVVVAREAAAVDCDDPDVLKSADLGEKYPKCGGVIIIEPGWV